MKFTIEEAKLLNTLNEEIEEIEEDVRDITNTLQAFEKFKPIRSFAEARRFRKQEGYIEGMTQALKAYSTKRDELLALKEKEGVKY